MILGVCGSPRAMTTEYVLREALASAPGAPSRVIALGFGDLRRLCRHQRGGKCRETQGRCEPGYCPQIRKTD